MIFSLQDLDVTKQYSYADYLTWQFSERIELLKGYIRQMAAPSSKHQRIAFQLVKTFGIFFETHPCRVYFAPFDVRLYNRKKSLLADKDIYTIVQPDICVICDSSKIDEKGCNGSPDLIIEILSPSNAKTDLQDKYKLYEESGVTEYWVVFPNDCIIQQFVLEDDRYKIHGVFDNGKSITPFLFPDLSIELEEVFRP
jgi:Uma2 family endonuclease